MRFVIAAVALTVALSGCTGHSTPAAAPLPSTATATDAASALLRTAILPPHARAASAVVTDAAELPACTPLDTAVSHWFVPGATLDSVSAFLEAHPTGTLTDVSHGRATAHGAITSEFVSDEKDGSSTMLVFTFQLATSGMDLRVDAEVAPKGSSCVGHQPAIIG